ncbi:hypothetical protein D5085_04520 [Ectothiorhodospiraceae bacterium BW-2]|nr:hypothetical protein D5085_04520 [Ectothiorhodospiraceae bacterium BW-2]
MREDEIMTEVWTNRDKLTAHYHHNLNELVAALQQSAEQRGAQLVDRRQPGKKQAVADTNNAPTTLN